MAYRCIFGCVLDFSGFKNGWWPPFLRSWPIGAKHTIHSPNALFSTSFGLVYWPYSTLLWIVAYRCSQ